MRIEPVVLDVSRAAVRLNSMADGGDACDPPMDVILRGVASSIAFVTSRGLADIARTDITERDIKMILASHGAIPEQVTRYARTIAAIIRKDKQILDYWRD